MADNKNYSQTDTEKLIQELINCGPSVPYELVKELRQRNDAAPYLLEILEKDECWDSESSGKGWAPIHAVHLIGVLHSIEHLDRLINALKIRAEDFEDWLTEAVPGILAKFGPEGREKFKELALDDTADLFVRNAAVRAVCAITYLYPEYTSDTIQFLRKIINSDRNDADFLALRSLVANDLAEFRDPAAREDLEKAIYEGKIDTLVIDIDSIERIYDGIDTILHREKDALFDPMEHFYEVTRDKQLYYKFLRDRGYYWRIMEEAKKAKIGRNDPCLCGSGKKYKKCCLKLTLSQV